MRIPITAQQPLAPETEAKVLKLLADHAGTIETLTRATRIESLDMDSMDLIEFAQTLDDEVGIAIDPAVARGAETLGDILDAAAAPA